MGRYDSAYKALYSVIDDLDSLLADIEKLEDENKDLAKQLEFYKSAYQEQLKNSVTLSDSLERPQGIE